MSLASSFMTKDVVHFLSPMGDAHFFSANSPQNPAFVQVGDEVFEDTVICVIEWNGVKNEVRAETRGIIVAILAGNGQSIKFGQRLFTIWPY